MLKIIWLLIDQHLSAVDDNADLLAHGIMFRFICSLTASFSLPIKHRCGAICITGMQIKAIVWKTAMGSFCVSSWGVRKIYVKTANGKTMVICRTAATTGQICYDNAMKSSWEVDRCNVSKSHLMLSWLCLLVNLNTSGVRSGWCPWLENRKLYVYVCVCVFYITTESIQTASGLCYLNLVTSSFPEWSLEGYQLGAERQRVKADVRI